MTPCDALSRWIGSWMTARSGEQKKRGLEPAIAAAAIKPEDRSVKQRRGPAADASSSPATAASTHSSVTPLTRLPSVLVHLVMQQLSLEELARLASTCKLMRADAVHPSAGRYVLSSPDDIVSLERGQFPDALRVHSPLGRAHLPVTIQANVERRRLRSAPQLAAMSHSQRVAALIEKIAGWSRVEGLNLTDAADWPEQDALTLLQSPSVQRVQQVEGAAGVWLREAVQTALCHLPLLTTLAVTLDENDHPSLRLHPSAFAATSLRSLVIDRAQVSTFRLTGLVSASPQLTSLALRIDQYSRSRLDPEVDLVLWLMRHCRSMLSQLRVLKLKNFCPSTLDRAELRDWLRAMPALRYLRTDSWHPNEILRGLTSAGAAALPDLRVVRFWQDQSGDTPGDGYIDHSLLRQFLAAYPRVRYCLSIVGDGDEATITEEEYAGWPQVCTALDHAEPDADGIAGRCVHDSDASAPHGHAALAAAASPEGEGLGSKDDDADASVIGVPSGAELIDAPPLSPAASLRIIDDEYQQAMAKAGPWVPPTQA